MTNVTKVGEYESISSIEFNPNYDVTFKNGKITVNKKAVQLTAPSLTLTYDSADYDGYSYKDQFENWYDNQVDDNGENYITSYEVTNVTKVGEYDAISSIEFNSNYDVTFKNGKITVNKQTAQVTADSFNIVYASDDYEDFDSLNDGWADSQVDGNGERYIVSCKFTTFEGVGEYATVSEIVFNPNYDVTFVNGTTTVTKKEVTVTAPSFEVMYDSYDYYSIEDLLSNWFEQQNDDNGESYILDYKVGEVNGVGNVDTLDWVVFNPNYKVNFTNGKITVTPYVGE